MGWVVEKVQADWALAVVEERARAVGETACLQEVRAAGWEVASVERVATTAGKHNLGRRVEVAAMVGGAGASGVAVVEAEVWVPVGLVSEVEMVRVVMG